MKCPDIVVQVEDLRKNYGDAVAVNGVSFQVRAGEVFGLLGPNGAGKTTTILSLIGLTEIDGGRLRVLGHDPMRDSISVKRHVGYMPDAVGFYDHLSAMDNLRYTAQLMGLTRRDAETRIAAALRRLRLSDVAHQHVASYSRGMRQRLALAEVIVKQAQVAILDEPTSGLDPSATEEFLQLVSDLANDGVGVIMSSHLLEHMQRICDRVALFSKGRIVLSGKVTELATAVLGHRQQLRLETCKHDAGLIQSLAAINGVIDVKQLRNGCYEIASSLDVRQDVLLLLSKQNHALRQLIVVEPSLDEIYNHYFDLQRTMWGSDEDES